MKVAIISESPRDEAALKVLVDGVIGSPTERIAAFVRTRPGGWPHVLQSLSSALPFLHYRTEAEALVVVADSDNSVIHQHSHEEVGGAVIGCRLCELRQTIKDKMMDIQGKPRYQPSQSLLKVAVGVAVPSIEAWYLCLSDSHISEAAWRRKLEGERSTYTSASLKEKVYGVDPISEKRSRELAVAAASSLTHNLPALEERFRVGFGHLADEIRKWRQ